MNRALLGITVLAALTACFHSDRARRREYDAEYDLAVRRCGHPDTAFQDGYNAGYAGQKMYGDWSAMCTPETQQASVEAYRDGFFKGADTAPVQVIHTVRGLPAPAVAQCTFDRDCGAAGYHCRDRACLGYGGPGDRCVFSEDCTSGHCFGSTCHE
jgi:hypothetical protein